VNFIDWKDEFTDAESDNYLKGDKMMDNDGTLIEHGMHYSVIHKRNMAKYPIIFCKQI